jgi:hypothetical protein
LRNTSEPTSKVEEHRLLRASQPPRLRNTHKVEEHQISKVEEHRGHADTARRRTAIIPNDGKNLRFVT